MKPPLIILNHHPVKHPTKFVNVLPRVLIAVYGYKKEYVANKLGISASKLSRVLYGDQGLSVGALGSLARLLNCSVKMMVSPKFTSGYIQKALLKQLKSDALILSETHEENTPTDFGLIDSDGSISNTTP